MPVQAFSIQVAGGRLSAARGLDGALIAWETRLPGLGP